MTENRWNDNEHLGEHSFLVMWRLKMYVALLSCLGGLVLSVGTETELIPVIAVFFAIFGFVFVDWLELFALPPIAAYSAMGLSALYCVSDFMEFDAPGNHQMIAVAQLLVFVQAILMLQRKTRRIIEQLLVFCLLELIVAAVFNNAINYGLLLIPISVVGVWALCLLTAWTATEGIDNGRGLAGGQISSGMPHRLAEVSTITTAAPESTQSLASAAFGLSRVTLFTLAPAVTLVGMIFFYALPRTTDAARFGNRGNALVGFDDEVRLEQFGQMLQSNDIAVRLHMTDRNSGKAYSAFGGIYLRGRVLERYAARMGSRKNSAVWSAVPVGQITGYQRLPVEFTPKRSTDSNFYDAVDVHVTCESTRTDALFAIAPYYRDKVDPDIVHLLDRWTIARTSKESWVYPRTKYSFSTNAFRSGIQSELISRWAEGESMMSQQYRGRFGTRQVRDYIDELLAFDVDSMPTAAKLAEQIVTSVPDRSMTDYEIAKLMERYMMKSRNFRYTLNLDAESIPGLDPIEQFLAVDRRGHCQYFASALTMMLRSQNIPARIVVGYHTDEFVELGGYYVARQLHAHAWVEALIEQDQLSNNRTVYGQPRSKEYWLRLDPTPTASRRQSATGGVGQVMDIAQNMWDDYVVDMDAALQDNAFKRTGVNPMHHSYFRLISRLELIVGRIRAGELGGGALANREFFSFPAALLGIVLAVGTILLLRVRPPMWIQRRIGRDRAAEIAKPSIPFYAETLDQLARVGVIRSASQTPSELIVDAVRRLQHPIADSIVHPLDLLTDAFYRLRFGAATSDDTSRNGHSRQDQNHDDGIDEALAELTRSVDLMAIGDGVSERNA